MSITTSDLINEVRLEMNRSPDDSFYSADRILAVANQIKDSLAPEIRLQNEGFFAVVPTAATTLAANTSSIATPSDWLSTITLEYKLSGNPDTDYRHIRHLPRSAQAFHLESGWYDELGKTIYLSGNGFSYPIDYLLTYVGSPKKFVVGTVVTAATETVNTDDLLYPHWYLRPAILAFMLKQDNQAVADLYIQKAEALKEVVLANVRNTNPDAPVRVTPFRMGGRQRRRW